MRWYGSIGFETFEDDGHSKYTAQVIERNYYGEVYNRSIRKSDGEGRNENVTYSQELSVISDPYLMQHYSSIAYVVLHYTKWKVTDIRVEHPRLKLTLGGLWNENERGVGQTPSGNTYGK